MLLIFRDLYKQYDQRKGDKNKKKQEFCKKIALVYLPMVVVLFTSTYWFIGLRNAGII